MNYYTCVCNNNLNYGLGMLWQRSKHNIDYKIHNLFYSVKVSIAKFSQRLMCSYFIVLCCTANLNMELPSLSLKELFWLSQHGHTKSLGKGNKKRFYFSFKDIYGKLSMLLSFTFTDPELVFGKVGPQGIMGNNL